MTPDEMTRGGTYRLEFVGGLSDSAGRPREMRGRFIGHAVMGPPAAHMVVTGEVGMYVIEHDRLRHVQSVDSGAGDYGPRALLPDRAQGTWP
jgi:hypothetical protein